MPVQFLMGVFYLLNLSCADWAMEPGKIFVGGISWDTNEDRLRGYFQTFGEVVEAVIMKDRATGRARGFGFVIYADPAVAELVVRQKHIIDGRTVSCSYISFYFNVAAYCAVCTGCKKFSVWQMWNVIASSWS